MKERRGREKIRRRSPWGMGVLFLCLVLLLGGCQKDGEPAEEKKTAMDYAAVEDWSVYVSLEAYTDLEIPLSAESDPKGERVWTVILERAEILSYPEEQVSYYAAQKKATYRYYGEKQGWSLEETLEKLEVTEEQILSEAREMVKGDLVYHYIVSDAGIVLTEEERATLFDRYAEQYAERYGYRVSYVKEELSELVYDSMLYDKTMEYLILNNRFVLGAETAK